MVMKRRIIVFLGLSIVAPLTQSVRAQRPAIQALFVDEPKRALNIYGISFGTSTGVVTVNDQQRPVSTWRDTLITCSMPDSGAGYAGMVKIFAKGDSSIPHALSAFTLFASQYNWNGFFGFWGESWFIKLRVDLEVRAPWYYQGFTLHPSRGTRGFYSVEARDQVTATKGHGWLYMPDYDSSSTHGVSASVGYSPNNYFDISARMYGASLNVDTAYNSHQGSYEESFILQSPLWAKLDSNFKGIRDTIYSQNNQQHVAYTETYIDSVSFPPARPKLSVKLANDLANLPAPFPNPFDEKLSITFSAAHGELESNLVNTVGQIVARLHPKWKGDRTMELSLGGQTLSQGIYFLQIISATERKIFPVVHR